MLEVMSFSEEVKARHMKEAAQQIASILREGIDSGIFEMDDPVEVAETLQLAFDGMYAPLMGQKMESYDKFDTLMNIILHGIIKR